jgi:hypothetical protein
MPGPNAKEGFLLKVLGVDEADGRTVLDTEAASLFEAVLSGGLVANPGAFEEVSAGQGLAEYEYAEFDPGGPFHTLPCNGSIGSLELAGSVDPGYEPFFDMSWRRRGPLPRIESAEAGVRGNVTVKATARSGVAVDCTLDPPGVSIPVFAAVVFAGPVPVPITVHANASLGVGAKLRAQSMVSATAGIDAAVALEYRRGDELAGKVVVAPNLSVPQPETEVFGSGEVRVKPGIGMTVGWSAGALGKVAAIAKINLVVGLEASWKARRQPPAKVCAPISIEGKIVFPPIEEELRTTPTQT